jgi:hypothetical protein
LLSFLLTNFLGENRKKASRRTFQNKRNMSLISQIESNDITSLKVDAMAKEAFEGAKVDVFLEALAKNNSITSIAFKGDFLACLRGDNRSDVIKAISKLPALQEVTLGNSLVLACDLTELLLKAKALRTLSLEEVCLQGDEEFCGKFETALSHHGTLKEFHLTDCLTSNQKVDLEKLKKAGNKEGSSIGINPAAATPISAKSA